MTAGPTNGGLIARVEISTTGLAIDFGGAQVVQDPQPDPEPTGEIPRYTLDTRPGGAWRAYRPKLLVEALRLRGPFEVVYPDGSVARVEDGWLVYVPDGLRAVPAEFFASLFERA